MKLSRIFETQKAYDLRRKIHTDKKNTKEKKTIMRKDKNIFKYYFSNDNPRQEIYRQN